MTIREEITQRNKQIETLSEWQRKRSKHFVLLSIVFFILIAVVFVVTLFTSDTVQRQIGDNAMSLYEAGDYEGFSRLCRISDASLDPRYCKLYEHAFLGCSNQAALQYGEIFPSEKNLLETETFWNSEFSNFNDPEKDLFCDGVSFINVFEDTIYFRNNKDHKAYYFNSEMDSPKLLIDGNVGEMLLDGKTLYYINEDTNNLWFLDLDTDTYYAYSFVACSSFAIVCNYIYAFDSNNRTLQMFTKKFGVRKKTIYDVDRFYIGDYIYIQSGNQLLYSDYKLTNIDLLKNLTEGYLLGASYRGCFIHEKDNVLFLYKNGPLDKVVQGCSILKSIYDFDETITYVSCSLENGYNEVLSTVEYQGGLQ